MFAGADVSTIASSSWPSQRFVWSLWDEWRCSNAVCCTLVSYHLCITVSNWLRCSSLWYVTYTLLLICRVLIAVSSGSTTKILKKYKETIVIVENKVSSVLALGVYISRLVFLLVMSAFVLYCVTLKINVLNWNIIISVTTTDLSC